MSYLRGMYGRFGCYGPEVRTRCRIQFISSYPHRLWARSEESSTLVRDIDFTEDGEQGTPE